MEKKIKVGIHRRDFELEAELGRVKAVTNGIGAVVSFLGTAREMTGERKVTQLSFVTYGEMALPALRELADEAMERFGLLAVTIEHRVGDIPPGGNIVLIIAAAGHRAAAFDGARWCIDRLKERIPIWKKECYADGQAWVQETP